MNDNDTTSLSYSPIKGFSTCDPKAINRATLFGDGVFETMVFWNGSIRFPKEHTERLDMGLKKLKISRSGLTVNYLEDFLKQNFPNKNQLRVRWNVFRGGQGKYTPLSNQAKDLIIVQPLDKPVKIKQTAYISESIMIHPSPWSHCKTLNALSYVMANIERKEMGMDEVILLDHRGFVSEAGSANIFWVKNDIFHTPSLSCNCIAGVGRRKIKEALGKSGASLIEGEFSVNELLNADQIFTSNVTGIAYLAHLENQSYITTPLPVVERVFE